MDINNNQQINTFLKGMNTDVSDALIDSSQYRYAENLRPTTDKDNNSGELRLIEGASLFHSFSGQTLLRAYKIRDINIFVTKDNNKHWYIHRIKDDETEHTTVLTGNSDNITDDITLVGRYEDKDHVYLYIADGDHEIRQLNVGDGASNVSDEQIWSTLHCPMPKISIVSLEDDGLLRSGKVQYAYRLYKKHGATTDMSSPSNMVSIIDYDTTDTALSKNTKGYKTDSATGKSAKIKIDNIDRTKIAQFDKLLIIRINYIQNGQAPTISVIYDDDIPNNTDCIYEGIDIGYSVRTFSVNEYYETYNLGIKPKILESKDNYLLAANLSYSFEDIDNLFDDSDFEAPQIETSGTGKRISWRLKSSDLYKLDAPEYIDNTNKIVKQVPTLRRGETYRFGVILYTEDGRKSSVKHIADITIPNDYSIYEYSNDTWYGKSIGVEFTISDMTNIAAWEIVRSIRKVENSRTITTGIFGFTMNAKKHPDNSQDGKSFEINFNSGFLTGKLMHSENSDGRSSDIDDYNKYKYVISNVESDTKLCFLASPETVYDALNTEDIINANDSKLKINYWMPATQYDGIQNYIYVHKKLNIPFGTTGTEPEYPYPLKVLSDRLDFTFGKTTIADPDNVYYYWRNNSHKLVINGSNVYTTFNLISPISSQHTLDKEELEILKVKHVDSPTPESAMPDGKLSFYDDTVVLRDKTFMRWSMFGAAYVASAYGEQGNVTDTWLDDGSDGWEQHAKSRTISGSTGAGMLIATNNNIEAISNVEGFPITFASIIKKPFPYGDSKDYNYIQYGDYITGQDNNTQSVFDGDCYIRQFEYNALHAFYIPYYSSGIPFGAIVYQVPIETEVDLFGSFGHTFRKILSINNTNYYDLLDMESKIGSVYTQDNPAYLYNFAYSANPTLTVVSGEDESDYRSRSGQYDVRVHASELKTNNETIDSWLKFKALNYIDVDSRYGAITDMELFKTHFVFWQDKATGVLSINERTIINDSDYNQIVLGSGDILQRFDYISQLYGMKENHFSKAKSDNALYWWDYDRREILQYSGLNLLPLIKTRGVTNYIQDNENKLTDKPALAFDNRYDELLSHVTDKTIVYNEPLSAFSSIYNIKFAEELPYRNKIKLVSQENTNIKVYNWDDSEQEGKSIYGNVQLKPLLNYVVNANSTMPKVFDIATFGGRFYGGDNMNNITFTFDTPLKQHSTGTGNDLITNREYDFRLAIPRNDNSSYGDRMRGKTMQCELKSDNNSTDFSLQYIITKYRMSWS